MIAYVDSSVLLRVAFAQPNALPQWRRIDRGVSSALLATESLRTLDRARLRAQLPDTEVARRRSTILAQALGRKQRDRKSTRLNSSHLGISYAVFCLKKK